MDGNDQFEAEAIAAVSQSKYFAFQRLPNRAIYGPPISCYEVPRSGMQSAYTIVRRPCLNHIEIGVNMKNHLFRVRVLFLILFLVLTSALGPAPARAASYFIDISGPPNSGVFGQTVTVLPNGNFVVTDPDYPFYTDYTEARGAVYLYSPNGVLISTLRGSQTGNSVGGGGITVLTSGNYVVNSPFWDSPTTDGVGAVTWCSQVTGCNGFVSASNSLVGSSNGDLVGYGGVTALNNGNYVVGSPHWWAPGYVYFAGAVTWGNGAGGTTGVVSASNSLVGGTINDQVGGNVIALANGNYLALDPSWDNAGVVDAGMIAWGNGMGGTTGVISAANSLVGTTTGDNVGDDFWGRVIELPNGNYVVVTPSWDLDATHQNAGAVTWGSGTAGVAGPISASNSLVGNSDNIPPGTEYNVTVLKNGNYVVASPLWSPDGKHSHWGAVTWGSGTAGVSGQITASNSLVGGRSGDYVGDKVIALTNGNYVVSSPDWSLDETHSYVGAVTWGNGTSGITGPVSSSNSLIGRSLMSAGGGGVIALANGNYAISSPTWSQESPGPNNIGAVTWGNGTSGTRGAISTSNSLVGINTYDSIGDGGLVALTNGNFVVISKGTWSGVPSVTWVDGSHVTTGVVSAANSLVGSTADDQVGSGGVKALANGNYVVVSPYWDNGGITDAGAVTWGNGAGGTTSVVSAANSLVGSTADDRVGENIYAFISAVTILTNGNYVVSAPKWDSGSVVDAGAVTWGNGTGGTMGPVSASNSLVGGSAGDNVGSEGFGGEVAITALPDGNYLVNSPLWKSLTYAGAVTWGNGISGTVGVVSASNSLVNTCPTGLARCQTGINGVKITALPDGNISMDFPEWTNGSNNGAVSLMAGDGSTVGLVGADNSVLGTAVNKGFSMVSVYDPARAQLIVGRPYDNKVTILRHLAGPLNWLYLPAVFK
jgi:hypothetical protein